ncbi:aminotransferase class I/II-fold pyridoxal phosphate-dependent enzyme [Planococcus sp. N028]|uniref:Aminotransferase n=1 Tax=Planococcus shixiaomingii TaxID=3058393 RepID=A0ABT8N1J6_9BACL|nr:MULTISPECIES: aminotransferase class I/II-fold pyridoxal phosphate-dependent enzyme [unclassified Planococcus (in: firmicutes)]MDN7241751.1 aminotransferase class I/II-fold pyridoxal phosphate-dependent enzyme [Planococcus sp. N028]WKA54037.1 aminotransferase class I/II-fold pyridoxal phosphate-dependent enzyme [Planococcus sp. N022]
MPLTLNPRAEGLAISGIRQFFNQLVDYPDAINLTIGQPDFPTPEKVKQAGMAAIAANLTSYSHNAGLIELRQEIAAFFNDRYGLTYEPKTEIIVTNGASEALDSVFRTILEPGDEVIIPAPCYTGYVPLVSLNGGKAVLLDTSDTGLVPTAERLKALITNKTKAILLNFPSNPTGVTISKEQMTPLVDELKQHDIFIVSDEIYSENSFESKHESFASYTEIKDRTFLVQGLSKSHSMTGWRMGFLLGPEQYMKHILKVHMYNSVCASLPSQHAAIEALKNNRDAPEEMNRAYKERRDFVYGKLLEMGLDVVKPKGAFYIFPSVAKFGMTSFEFATRLLKEGGVAAVPGSAFTESGEGFLRISYAYSMPTLERAMERMGDWIKTLEN